MNIECHLTYMHILGFRFLPPDIMTTTPGPEDTMAELRRVRGMAEAA
jgi:hypothetical protein